MGVLDFRRFLPAGQPQDYAGVDSLWRPGATFAPSPDPRKLMEQHPNVWATGGGPSGPGTFSTPMQADGAPQQQPPPPLVGTPKKPEILTGPRDERTVPPPVAPPTSRKVPEVLTPIAGPDNKPAPDERLVPTPASTAPSTSATQSGNLWDRLMALQKDGKLGPAIAALAKMGGGGAGHPAPPPWRSSMSPSQPGYHPGNPGSAAQMMQGLTGGAQKREEERQKKRASRRRESDRYDILGGRG